MARAVYYNIEMLAFPQRWFNDYRSINTDATVKLAQAAERAGVKRFVFLSSIRAQSGPSAEGVLTATGMAVALCPTDLPHATVQQ